MCLPSFAVNERQVVTVRRKSRTGGPDANARAARITRLSSDPARGMAGRCVQGLIDVLEGNYGRDLTKMPYVANKEAFGK